MRAEIAKIAGRARRTTSVLPFGIRALDTRLPGGGLARGRELASVGERDAAFPLPHSRGDEFHHGSPTPDPRDLPPKGPRPRDIHIPDLHLDTIRVRTRDFR